jgi:hypothetical protein
MSQTDQKSTDPKRKPPEPHRPARLLQGQAVGIVDGLAQNPDVAKIIGYAQFKTAAESQSEALVQLVELESQVHTARLGLRTKTNALRKCGT